MIDCGSLEFAQARLQARHAQRAGPAAWQRLETTREFNALLEAVRSSSLRPWVVGITAPATPQRIEAVLRAHWRAGVAEVAGWMPAPWQAAVNWCAVLPDLPVLQHLARGAEPSTWMQDDPVLGPLCQSALGERAATLAVGPLGALVLAWPEPDSIATVWHQEWQRRLPRRLGGASESLGHVEAVVVKHAASFAAAPPGSGCLLREALQARLTLLWRRAALEPAAAFVYLALCALDLERLRGELLRRALFARLGPG